MEGQISKIRTMARDLASARGLEPRPQAPIAKPAKQPETKPTQQAIPAQHDEQMRLSKILEEARGRIAAQESPRQKVVIPKTPEPRKTLADVLPIEPLVTAQGKPSFAEVYQGRPPLSSPGGGLPPSNLPTGEPYIKISSEEAPYELPSLPQKESAQEKPKRTPEEILGIRPARVTLPPKPPSAPYVPAAKPLSLRPARRIPKFIPVTGFLGAILVILLYGIYWKVFLQKDVPVPPAPTQKVTEQLIPEALIAFRDTKIIEIKTLEYDALKPKLDAFKDAEFLPESLTYIPIKYSAQNQVRYLTLAEVFKTLRIDAPPVLSGYTNYSLYLYSQGIEAEQLCREMEILAKSCFGPRLGIVIELTKHTGDVPSKDLVINTMEEWEKTIVDDINPLMLAVPQAPEGYTAGVKFAIGEHRGFDTHYLNLPIPATSVDWILTDTDLIIATSKDAARAAVDALK